jgi:hypothetical protein
MITRQRRPSLSVSGLFIFALALIALLFAILSGKGNLDYPAYVHQWRVFLNGSDPWLLPSGESTSNAYGPLHLLPGLLLKFHVLAPKLFFVSLWFGVSIWLIHLAQTRAHIRRAEWLFVLFMTILNPFFWGRTVVQGMHDIVLAVLVLFALHFCDKNKEWLCGLLLAAGCLFKFVPILLLPIVSLDGFRLRWKMILSFVLTSAAGFCVAYALWGTSCFAPLTYASARPPSWDSIFRFLDGEYSPLRLLSSAPQTAVLSTPILLLAILSTTLWVALRRINVLTAAVFGLIVIYTFYRAGHAQFQASVLLLGCYWFIVQAPQHAMLRWQKQCLLLYVFWFAIIRNLLKFLFDRYAPGFFEESVGLATFLVQIGAIVALIHLGNLMKSDRPEHQS